VRPATAWAASFIPSFVAQAAAKGLHNGVFQASVLHLDISGFTHLTEQLMQHGAEGAEALSDILDSIFHAALFEVHELGGIVPHFAGDAFAAIFEGKPTSEIENLAHKLQKIFQKQALQSTPFGVFEVGLRIGLAYGAVEWGIVGAPSSSFYFKGSVLLEAALAQTRAKIGGLAFSENFREQQAMQVSSSRLPNFSGNVFDISAQDLAAQPFVIPAVLDFAEKGEFRDVVSLFISIDGVETHADLAQLAQVLLPLFSEFGGYFKELDFSEKGLLAVGFWGAPTAFENNIPRALQAAWALSEALKNINKAIPALRFRMGMSAGMAYTGLIGSAQRQQFAVIGESVNLAARLAMAAPWGKICVEKPLTSAAHGLFSVSETFKAKGIRLPVERFEFEGWANAEKTDMFHNRLVARDAELESLNLFYGQQIARETAMSLVFVYGESGVGKSHLVYEWRRRTQIQAEIHWLTCACDPILRKPFNPFISFLKNFFNQKTDASVKDNIAVFWEKITKIHSEIPENALNGEEFELQRTALALAALLGLSTPDALWNQLDAKGRYDNTLLALSHLFRILSLTKPVTIELEDAHWLDDDSIFFLQQFLQQFLRPKTAAISENTTQAFPIILVSVQRYTDEGLKKRAFMPEMHGFLQPNGLSESGSNAIDFFYDSLELDLNALSETSLEIFVHSKLNAPPHPDFLQVLSRLTNGNPFFAEQALAYLSENNLLEKTANQWRMTQNSTLKITTSMNSILLARIDRLSNPVKETVKAAAVIGREFELPVLSAVMQQQKAFETTFFDIQPQISEAEKGQIWRASTHLRYIFKHTLLREAVYNMQLKKRLQVLHASIAQALEKIHADNIEGHYLDLAYHYEQARIRPKMIFFLEKAADYARRNFQNQQALDLYDRLSDANDNPRDYAKIYIKKGKVLQNIGRWGSAEICFKAAIDTVNGLNDVLLQGRAYNALGVLLMLRGDYELATNFLERGTTYFIESGDSRGIAASFGNLGNLFFRQGDYAVAEGYFNKSLELTKKQGVKISPQIVSHLGLTYMNQGKYSQGVYCQEVQLAVCEQDNDILGKAILNTNIGIVWAEQGALEAAQNHFEAGLVVAQQLGNRQLMSIILGCLGNIYAELGDFEKAAELLEQDFNICHELGDRQGIAIALELKARLADFRGSLQQAESAFSESWSLSKALGYQKGISRALFGLGKVAAQKGEFEQAQGFLNQAIQVSERINNPLILGFCYLELGLVLLQKAETNAAKQVLNAATRVALVLENKKLNAQLAAFRSKF
jgi:class 3 adenylate cyclase/tetratricopeptide (TPR) repeat protein